MRERRRAEIQNREQVGFLGTLFSRRAINTTKPTRREVEEYKPADERQDTYKSQVDNEAVAAEAYGAPSATATAHGKTLAFEPESRISAGNHAVDDQGEVGTWKSPALSLMRNVSSREAPAPSTPVAQDALADAGLDRNFQPQHDTVIEQEK